MVKAPQPDPQSVDPKHLEMTVLGFVLTFPQQFYEVQELRELDLLDPTRRMVFLAMRELHDTHGPQGLEAPSLLIDKLGGMGVTEEKSFALLTEARDFAPATANGVQPVVKQIKTNSLKRAVAAAGRDMVQLGEGNEDGEMVAAMAGAMLADALRAGASAEATPLAELMQSELDDMAAVERGDYRPKPGLLTGLQTLDNLTYGMHGGEMIVIGARPSMGKSSLANHMAMQFAKVGPGALFTLEMRGTEWAQRLACSISQCDLQKARMRLLNPEERKRYVRAANQLAKDPIYVFDEGGFTMSRISATARRFYHEHGIKWVVIDYLGLIDHVKTASESDNSAISRTSKAIKTLAKNLDIPVIVLSQLNRQPDQRDNKRPRMSDLRDSGSIEQDADVILFLYREAAYYTEEEKQDHEHDEIQVAEIIVAKQRNGPIGTARVAFRHSCAAFENLPDGTWAGATGQRMHQY